MKRLKMLLLFSLGVISVLAVLAQDSPLPMPTAAPSPEVTEPPEPPTLEVTLTPSLTPTETPAPIVISSETATSTITLPPVSPDRKIQLLSPIESLIDRSQLYAFAWLPYPATTQYRLVIRHQDKVVLKLDMRPDEVCATTICQLALDEVVAPYSFKAGMLYTWRIVAFADSGRIVSDWITFEIHHPPTLTSSSVQLTPTATPTFANRQRYVDCDTLNSGSVLMPQYAYIPPGDSDGLICAIWRANQYPQDLYTIYLDNGTYTLSETIVVHGKVHILGRGIDQTIIAQSAQQSGGSNSMNSIFKLPGDLLILEHVTVTGGISKSHPCGASICFGEGGAVWVQYENSHLKVQNSRFYANTATDRGGAIYLMNGSVEIHNSIFHSNTAYRGGAIYANQDWAATPAVWGEGVDFWQNKATDVGGAIYNATPSAKLWFRQSNFRGNSSSANTALRKHVFAPVGTVSIDARQNRWQWPVITPNATLQGVDTRGQLTATVAIVTRTPVPIPITPTQPINLADFGIVPEGTWTTTELIGMLDGVTSVGLALQQQYGGNTPAEAFKRIMYFPDRSRIEWVRLTGSGYGCTTYNNVSPPLQARIECRGEGVVTEHTVVHETGHILVGRTGGYGIVDKNGLTSLYGYIGTSRIADPQYPNITIFGVVSPSEWGRGDRGWGSSSPLISNAQACYFQQNPLRVSGKTDEEVDEGAADMFLNWVYYKLYKEGFQDVDWTGYTLCRLIGPEDPVPSGTLRYNLMDTVMTDLGNARGW